MEDVAAHAGVSRALVSIVMRGVAGASDETRRRVQEAAANIGYRPDARARLLASGQSRLLGVVFGMSGRFHLELLDGLYVAAGAAGYELILSALTPSRDERRAVETLLDFRCEAVVLVASEIGAPVLAGRLPVVVIGWGVDDPSVDVIRTSDAEGMLLAVDHLTQLGHQRILHVDGGPGSVSTSRRRAYRAAMRRHGLDRYVRVVGGGINQEDGVTAARSLLAQESLPSAVIAYNDDVATGLHQTLFQAGVPVPGAVSIVGWDDSSLSRLPHLDLTTVRQDAAEMARLAVDRCAARLAADPIAERDLVLSPRLVIRSSTGAVGRHRPTSS
ncbi:MULTISPECIES: LacI family DNA-binding transcriptional regulator [unclassified Geodermatophilus]|uniref:LacI family DNA-binding transcriptional regulator n=1 Tax=unclassified Geodermatophilus TaxID=2637632 RepID=UPI003EE9619B